MPKTIIRKSKVKLIFTPSALPLVLEALGYKKMFYEDILVHISDGSYVHDNRGKIIKVSEIVGFQKGRIFTQKNVFKKVQVRKIK